MKNKKILLSAYACEPNRGSEPGVGWSWALGIAKLGHEVWVLTRKNNQSIIEHYWQVNTKPKNLNFIYYDVPKWLSWWKKGGRGVRTYNLLWQIGAYLKAKEANEKFHFDLVHHITFGVVRQPSFMGKLGIPFYLGPLGGGERCPIALRKGYPVRGKILDFIRDLLNMFTKIDPMMLYTFASATEIFAKTPESKTIIPKIFQNKVKVCIEIGIDVSKNDQIMDIQFIESQSIKLLYVGRFVYWKGMHIGLRAFEKALNKNPNLRLTMVGEGPEETEWKKLTHNCSDAVNWVSWVDQEKLKKIYLDHDALLFPSLHDSSGNVILESMSYSLPVICLNLGGPAVMVDDTCGVKVDVEKLTEEEVIDKLSLAILRIADDSQVKDLLKQGALLKATQMSWAAAIQNIYSENNQ